MTGTRQVRFVAILFLVLGLAAGYFNYRSGTVPEDSAFFFPFKLGLDLAGGTHLVYRGDLSAIDSGERAASMDALRDVIERRINVFGVSEPLIQVESSDRGDGTEGRLIVELPGVTDIDQAVALIGATPVLEFRIEREGITSESINERIIQFENGIGEQVTVDEFYAPSALTGRFLERAQLDFDPLTGEPGESLVFNDEGAKLFEEITEQNIGKTVAIVLDGSIISAPVVREAIREGKAQITGTFTAVDAKVLVGRLNAGALPIPIELLGSQTVGASLGAGAVHGGVRAGLIGFAFVAAFLVLWYRIPGFVAVVALAIYGVIVLAIFKLFPVTLTAAGIAGFILSIGMAVDANILIFERMKEELLRGRTLAESMREGFARAWPSIRDSNVSSMITALVLFTMSSSLVKGFALTFGIGVLVSMFTAITVTRTFLYSLGAAGQAGAGSKIAFLFGSGVR